jgi:hypothetical protein
MTQQRKPLPDRPQDWDEASEEEIVSTLLEQTCFVDPRWLSWVRQKRPAALRRALLLHADLGGYLGPLAIRFLKGGAK